MQVFILFLYKKVKEAVGFGKYKIQIETGL